MRMFDWIYIQYTEVGKSRKRCSILYPTCNMVGIVFNLGDWMSGLVGGLQNRLRGFESRIALKKL